jgi:hypothetical protein
MPTDPEVFATLERPVSEEDVKRLTSDSSEAPGSDRVLDHDRRGSILLASKAEYEVLPEELPREESILRARLCTPYYGKGYERGCWPEIAATLEFLRHRLPGGRVWYGPDGTEHVDEVTQEFLDSMWDYWAQHGSRPYYQRQPAAQLRAPPNGGPAERLGNSGAGGGPPSVS